MTLPLAIDLRVSPEPTLPPAVFELDQAGNPTEAALAAEAEWNDGILIWGREGWLQVGRICRWAEDLAGDVPDLECPEPR